MVLVRAIALPFTATSTTFLAVRAIANEKNISYRLLVFDLIRG
jgi:hypothetical protein